MRKIVWIMLAAMLLTFAACGGDAVSEQSVPTPALETVTPDCGEPTPTPTAEPTPVPTWSQEPEELTMDLEGETYTVMGFRYTSHLGYSMVYDPDWVRPEQYEGYDYYTAVTEVHMPEIYMQITKTDQTIEQVISDLEAQGAEQVGISRFGGCRGVQLAEDNGLVVVAYYVTQAGDTVYILETSYFWEAAEGFGARMWAMLETIEFADAPKASELKLMFRDKEIKDFTSAMGESTYITLWADEGASLEPAEWTVDEKALVNLYTDDTGCYIEVVGEGIAKVTAKCGDLEQSVIVRCIKEW